MIMPTIVPRGLYKVRDVARLFSVCTPTVYGWINLGKLNASVTPGGKRLRVPHEWILEFIENEKNGKNKGITNKYTLRFKILRNLRSRLSHIFKRQVKNFTIKEFLGCSLEEFLKHIEGQFQPGMTLENYGRSGWTLDHVIPCDKFDLLNPDQQKLCFHYTNLQPMWASDNIKKADKITRRNINKVVTNLHKFK